MRHGGAVKVIYEGPMEVVVSLKTDEWAINDEGLHEPLIIAVLLKKKCGYHWNTMLGSWSSLIDSQSLVEALPIVSRSTFARSWYEEALGIASQQIVEIPDSDRLSYRVFDDSNAVGSLEKPEGASVPFSRRLNLEELLQMDNCTLIEMGSMLGTARLCLSPEGNIEFMKRVDAATAFKHPLLERVSDAVVGRMGGHSKYVGLHLIIGGSYS